jgi:hypothetical protein
VFTRAWCITSPNFYGNVTSVSMPALFGKDAFVVASVTADQPHAGLTAFGGN